MAIQNTQLDRALAQMTRQLQRMEESIDDTRRASNGNTGIVPPARSNGNGGIVPPIFTDGFNGNTGIVPPARGGSPVPTTTGGSNGGIVPPSRSGSNGGIVPPARGGSPVPVDNGNTGIVPPNVSTDSWLNGLSSLLSRSGLDADAITSALRAALASDAFETRNPPITGPKPPVSRPPISNPLPPVSKPPISNPLPPVSRPPITGPLPPVVKPTGGLVTRQGDSQDFTPVE